MAIYVLWPHNGYIHIYKILIYTYVYVCIHIYIIRIDTQVNGMESKATSWRVRSHGYPVHVASANPSKEKIGVTGAAWCSMVQHGAAWRSWPVEINSCTTNIYDDLWFIHVYLRLWKIIHDYLWLHMHDDLRLSMTIYDYLWCARLWYDIYVYD